MGGTVAESMCRVGGWVLKMKLMLSQLSTKLYFEVEAELGNISLVPKIRMYVMCMCGKKIITGGCSLYEPNIQPNI